MPKKTLDKGQRSHTWHVQGAWWCPEIGAELFQVPANGGTRFTFRPFSTI